VLFEAVWNKEYGGFEWCDAEGSRVATEENLEEDAIKLVVCKAMKRKMLDVLVATWCLRVWYESAQTLKKEGPSEGVEGGELLTMFNGVFKDSILTMGFISEEKAAICVGIAAVLQLDSTLIWISPDTNM
jgi:hypothetical protein